MATAAATAAATLLVGWLLHRLLCERAEGGVMGGLLSLEVTSSQVSGENSVADSSGAPLSESFC